MDKLSHNIEQKYKEIIIMSEKISDMVDRPRKPNVKVIGVQKETKEPFGENNRMHLRRKLTWPKKWLVFSYRKGLLSARRI